MELIDQAVALHRANRVTEAEKLYRRVLAANNRDFDALHMLGVICAERENFEDAERLIRDALSIDPNAASCLHNYGNVLAKLDRHEEALNYFDRAIAISLDDAPIHSDRGISLIELGRLDDALVSFSWALDIDPNCSDALVNTGVCYLLRGDYERGWSAYANWCWSVEQRNLKRPRHFVGAPWRGTEPLDGKTILLYSETGFGDTIQFCRYARLFQQRGAQVILGVQPPLHRLLAHVEGVTQTVKQGDPLPAFDYHCALLSLPFAFRTTEQNTPQDGPYLRAEPAIIEKWRERLGSAVVKIGICWQGSNNTKSLPVAEFYNLSLLPNVRLISLQKGPGTEQLSHLPNGMRVQDFGQELDASPDAFLDTAAIMTQLDLVITSDTSIAHLAGALGLPTWVALKYVPDWRWKIDGSTSSWYPTIRLFRQKSRGDWKGAVRQMEEALVNLVAEKTRTTANQERILPTPTIPVAWGDLIDKITILEIKVQKIKPAAKRERVQKELGCLSSVAADALSGNPRLAAMMEELRRINSDLWMVEDALREKERSNIFDNEFVELARSVYKLNEGRSNVKNKINVSLSSEFAEEKTYLKW